MGLDLIGMLLALLMAFMPSDGLTADKTGGLSAREMAALKSAAARMEDAEASARLLAAIEGEEGRPVRPFRDVTPPAVREAMDCRLIEAGLGFMVVWTGDQVAPLEAIGWATELIDAVPFDGNGDGVTDLLFTYSAGSGLHYACYDVFDMARGALASKAYFADDGDDGHPPRVRLDIYGDFYEYLPELEEEGARCAISLGVRRGRDPVTGLVTVRPVRRLGAFEARDGRMAFVPAEE